jgi:hypothetical protein
MSPSFLPSTSFFHEGRKTLTLFLRAKRCISITRVKENQIDAPLCCHNLKSFSVGFHDTIDTIADQCQTLLAELAMPSIVFFLIIPNGMPIFLIF